MKNAIVIRLVFFAFSVKICIGIITCPHPLTSLTGTCNPSIAGTVGYNIGSVDTTPPAAPSGIMIN